MSIKGRKNQGRKGADAYIKKGADIGQLNTIS